MDITLPSYLLWWVTVIDIPVASTLFWMIWRGRKDTEGRLDDIQKLLETRHSQMRESLAAYKLEVAKTYSTQSEMRNLEGRLVAHLLRIESKLDKQGERINHGNN